MEVLQPPLTMTYVPEFRVHKKLFLMITSHIYFILFSLNKIESVICVIFFRMNNCKLFLLKKYIY